MYLNCTIPIPTAKGRISIHHQKKMTVVLYKVDGVYNPKTKLSEPKRVMIGKVVDEEAGLMIPNENFPKYFPDVPLDIESAEPERSNAIKAGTFMLYEKIVADLQLDKLLERHFEEDSGLILDLASYMITCENNVGQHYPDYAFNHALFTRGMQIKSDSSISRLLQRMSKDQIIGFLDDWNKLRGPQNRVYLTYDSTNKNSQAGDLDIVEYGHAKDDKGLPIFNVALAFDQTNQVPLHYDLYPGSINDVSQLQSLVNTMRSYNYRHVGIILDRGFFSRQNFEYMDQQGFHFLVMMKGCKKVAATVIKKVKGTFENDMDAYVHAYKLHATTVAHKLYDTDEKVRYFHVCYDPDRVAAEHARLTAELHTMKELLRSREGTNYRLEGLYAHYFEGVYSTLEDTADRLFLGATYKKEVIEEELNLCGYFCMISSEEMPASEAVHLYKGRDATEKLFMMMKSFLGAESERVHSAESLESKVFIEFIALIIRNRIYNLLKEHVQRLNIRKNYLTVPAAIREMDKFELTRHNAGYYRQSHALTKNQREIYQAIGLSDEQVKVRILNIAGRLTAAVAPEMPCDEE